MRAPDPVQALSVLFLRLPFVWGGGGMEGMWGGGVGNLFGQLFRVRPLPAAARRIARHKRIAIFVSKRFSYPPPHLLLFSLFSSSHAFAFTVACFRLHHQSSTAPETADDRRRCGSTAGAASSGTSTRPPQKNGCFSACAAVRRSSGHRVSSPSSRLFASGDSFASIFLFVACLNSPLLISCILTASEWATHGARPVRHLYSVTPHDHRSAVRPSYGPRWNTSGAVKSGVPHVSVRHCTSPPCSASPKSASFSAPSASTKMFDGLMSLWHASCACRNATASSIARAYERHRSSSSAPPAALRSVSSRVGPPSSTTTWNQRVESSVSTSPITPACPRGAAAARRRSTRASRHAE
eukprot:Rhum_TRINITY_DN14432_c19_g1::Rhum_TRINITY_DN14432_c19_g1_i1::g.91059::m.91059